MKSPADLIATLARQWHNADYRETRLLNPGSWPLTFTIGKPIGNELINNFDQVRAYIQAWRQVEIGKVEWVSVKFKSAQDAIEIPVAWELHKPSQWIAATQNANIQRQFQRLESLVTVADPLFHRFLIRQLHSLSDKPESDIKLALALALQLEPGCAQGVPLRALGVSGADSKFFERNRSLIIKLLDIRFDGLISEQGLETFLNAADNNDHWLLVVDLDGKLLPFQQLRVRDNELLKNTLPGKNLVIVENENCRHQLPQLSDTIAILGAGLNLAWMKAAWLAQKKIAYWGDLDTWGLSMLARARQHQPSLTPLLMTQEVFDAAAPTKAVTENVHASATPPTELTPAEQSLFYYLSQQTKGRLEQEFIERDKVMQVITEWAAVAK
jgi:hypothetical protein